MQRSLQNHLQTSGKQTQAGFKQVNFPLENIIYTRPQYPREHIYSPRNSPLNEKEERENRMIGSKN